MGAEKEGFSVSSKSWIRYTKVIVIELHVRMKLGNSGPVLLADRPR